MQTLSIPQLRKFQNYKDLFIHTVMGEATGHLLVTLHLEFAFSTSKLEEICSTMPEIDFR